MLLNPNKMDRFYPDEASREAMRRTVAFFESKGKAALKKDDRERVWYADFLDFVREEKLFARFLTPAAYGGGDPDYRWDTWRNCELNEILGFYGLHYWYTWQVSILGLGPLWMSDNEALKERTAALLEEGAVFAFGLSERAHGADLYSTEMKLSGNADEGYVANGSKYYIGNANKAAIISTFGKLDEPVDPEDPKYGRYVFFSVNPEEKKSYELVKNIVNVQSYVGEYELHDYPVAESEVLSKGRVAWDSALNTINVGKFNLGWASIGICTHSFYEAINHAAHRNLYGTYVTDFPHIRQLMTDAYTRLVAMKLFALRASDYFRAASPEDRRYLLYNPMVKMKVTTQGEEVINLLWDVIAAKGFEADVYFEMAARDIRALPKLEGTVHVNMALIIKFMPNYFFNPGKFPELPRLSEAKDDSFFFDQGPTKGLGGIQFHDYEKAYGSYDLPNLRVFKEQIALAKEMMMMAPPTKGQQRDIDYLLTVGELFTLVAYGQLILENAKIYEVDESLLDQIFDFMVRDFSKYALQLFSKPSSTEGQMAYCQKMIRKPVVDTARFDKVWTEHVYAQKDAYEMKP